jgi:hypothetical protein
MHFFYGFIFAYGSIGTSLNWLIGMSDSMCVVAALKCPTCHSILNEHFHDSREFSPTNNHYCCLEALKPSG